MRYEGIGQSQQYNYRQLRNSYNDLVMLEQLLMQGDDPNSQNEWGCLPVLYAFRMYNPVAVRLLQKHGADSSIIGDQSATDLALAAMEGDSGRIQILLDQGIDVNSRLIANKTALHGAAACGHMECVRLLLDRGAEPSVWEQLPDGTIIHDSTPLCHAHYRAGSWDIVELLREFGAVLEETSDYGTELVETSRHHLMPLGIAIGENDTEKIRLLLEQGIAPTGKPSRQAYKDCPLGLAAWMGYEEGVRLLLEYGAGNTQEALQHAYRMTFVDGWVSAPKVQPILLNAGAQIGLVEAILQKETPLVRQLVQEGADINERDELGRTPLMYATGAWSCFPEPEIFRLLLEASADVFVRTNAGETVHSLANREFRHCPEIAQLLAMRGWEKAVS